MSQSIHMSAPLTPVRAQNIWYTPSS